jgi:hypothetical protein
MGRATGGLLPPQAASPAHAAIRSRKNATVASARLIDIPPRPLKDAGLNAKGRMHECISAFLRSALIATLFSVLYFDQSGW